MRRGIAVTSDRLYSLIDLASDVLSRREMSAVELTRRTLDEIERQEPWTRAFIEITREAAGTAALQSDERRSREQALGLLDGLPVCIKDNIDMAGVRTTAGLKQRPVIPKEDAELLRKLTLAGMVVVGKTNMDEAAMGGMTRNPAFKTTYNPWGFALTAGGSSGGSAAALASNMIVAAIGTDTLGSTRIPASYCGVAAIKPTYGAISTRGVVPLCHQLDTVGIMARSVKDLQPLMRAVAGYDPQCPGSIQLPPECDAPKKVKVGLLAENNGIELDQEVAIAFDVARRALKELDWEECAVTLTGYDPPKARRAGLLLGEVDAAVTHEEILRKFPKSLSPEVRSLMEYGRDASADKISSAKQMATMAGREINNALENVDVILTPTTPQTAFDADRPAPANQGDFTAIANLAGCPAVSIPILANTRLPCGIQLIGRKGSDYQLLELALALETALPAFPRPTFFRERELLRAHGAEFKLPET